MEKKESATLWSAVFFLLVMALIGWAKFVDEKKEAELWYARYSDEVDELREVTDSRDDIDARRMACIHDRDLLQSTLDAIPAYCSAGLYEVTIDGLRARVNYLEGQLNSCTNAYTRDFWGEDARCAGQAEQGVSCGWDMCLCNDGFEGCPIYVLEYYTDQAICKTDRNCKSCMWQMVDNGGGLEHDEILWCLEHAYHP